jgi:hypothetical protein
MKNESKILGLFSVNRKIALELFKIFSIAGSISFSVFLVFLVLLWHWQYYFVFKIAVAIGIIDYFMYAYLISKFFSISIK